MKKFKLTDYEQGEYDCTNGYQASQDQSKQYYLGYGNEYANQQQADRHSQNQINRGKYEFK